MERSPIKLSLSVPQLQKVLEDCPEIELEIAKGVQSILLDRMTNRVKDKVERQIDEDMMITSQIEEETKKVLYESDGWRLKVSKIVKKLVWPAVRDEAENTCRNIARKSIEKEMKGVRKQVSHIIEETVSGAWNESLDKFITKRLRSTVEELVTETLREKLGLDK